MNPRIIVLAVAAIAVAGLTAFLARQFLLGSGEPEQQAPKETTEILVASKNLPMGHLIEAGDLIWLDWPNDGLHTNYIEKRETAIGDLNGYVVRYGIVGGEPISQGRIVGPGQQGFMAAVLGPDMRAVTIPVTRTSGVAGFIFPGDRVDVILTKTARDDLGVLHQVGETVLKNVRVLAIDLRFNDQNKANPALGKSVTLEVTPKMAEKVALLSRMGRISLAIRSLKMADTEGIEIYSPDDDLPVSNAQTHTWDAEVSRLTPPVNPPIQKFSVSRGGQTRVYIVSETEIMGEDDVRFADEENDNLDDGGDQE